MKVAFKKLIFSNRFLCGFSSLCKIIILLFFANINIGNNA